MPTRGLRFVAVGITSRGASSSGEQQIPAKYLRLLAQRYKVSISHLLRDENGDLPEAA